MNLAPRTRTLIVRVGVTVATCVLAWLSMGIYSGGRSYAGYAAPGRAFVRAALFRDSAGLTRQGVLPGVVSWALHADRDRTAALHALDRGLALGGGYRMGDTTLVWYSASAPKGGSCLYWSLNLSFVGQGPDRRIGKARVDCVTPTPLPGSFITAPSRHT